MVEGTRHERAALVITSYVIGFVTAFIGFGVTYMHYEGFANAPTQPASVMMSAREAEVTPMVALKQTEVGLVLVREDQEALLSSYNAGDPIGADGEYAVLSSTSLSPDELFAYFCEVPTVDSENCAPYVYSVRDAVVYPVTIDGVRVAFTADAHEVVWSESGPLTVASEVVDQLPQ